MINGRGVREELRGKRIIGKGNKLLWNGMDGNRWKGWKGKEKNEWGDGRKGSMGEI